MVHPLYRAIALVAILASTALVTPAASQFGDLKKKAEEAAKKKADEALKKAQADSIKKAKADSTAKADSAKAQGGQPAAAAQVREAS